MDYQQWQGVSSPCRITLEGRYARLEPLDAERHGQGLFAVAQAPGAEDRFRFLFDHPPADFNAMTQWFGRLQQGTIRCSSP